MKLAAVYNVWDGLEHLNKSINLIYAHVDHVVIVWQTVSNFGEVNPETAIAVQIMVARYPKVTHLYYQPDLKQQGHQNERNKRMIGWAKAKELGCSHFVFMDTDEYYPDFAQGKQEFIDRGLDTSYCKLITYFKEPTYILDPLEAYFVPFICTTNVKTIGGGFPAYCDPTRGVSPAGRCAELSIKMHHMSYVRKDIAQKLRNSSARVNIKNMEQRLREIDNWQIGQPHPFMPQHNIIEVPNLFV
jgi:hypothetical protein